MTAKLVTQILATSIRSKVLDFLPELILDLILKFLEPFKGFSLMLHQVNIPISTQVISKGHEVTKAIACGTFMGPHTFVCMIPNKSSTCSIIPLNGILVIFPMRHGSHVSRDPKSNESRSPSLWSLSMRFIPI